MAQIAFGAGPASAKPTLPHYSPARRALFNLMHSLRARADQEEVSLGYHRRQIEEGEANVRDLRAEADAVEMAARALGGMDKAGIVVEPNGDPLPPPPGRRLLA